MRELLVAKFYATVTSATTLHAFVMNDGFIDGKEFKL